jgi:glutamine amidotransferase PdxT
MLQKLPAAQKKIRVDLVRTPEDLERCDALIIPGGGEPNPPPSAPRG